MTKIFGAGFLCEVNTFSPFPVTETNFRECYYNESGNHGAQPHYYAQPLITMKQLIEAEQWQYVESLCTGAQPGGKIEERVYLKFRDKILSDLKLQMPVNAVFLYLHGAMVSEKCDDCEGDIIKRVRDIVGPKVFIGVEFDPHTHLTEKMIENANALVFIKEYPHTDYNERAKDLFRIMKGYLKKTLSPVTAVVDCLMIGMYATTLEPMKSFNTKIKHIEQATPDVLSISVIHGFPWGDVADVGTKILVITNNNYELAKSLASSLATELRSLKGKTMPKAYTSKKALQKARADTGEKPVVLADFSDNTGLGARGDSTFLLREVLNQRLTSVALSPLYDPDVIKQATEAGVDSTIDIKLGGKSKYSGTPLNLKNVVISKIVPKLTATFAGSTVNYGQAVTLHYQGIDIVVNNNRCQTFSTECFSKMGIDPHKRKILIVKSSEHFRHSFEKISNTILIVTTPGTISLDFSQIPYTKLTRRVYPIYQEKNTELEHSQHRMQV